ncbi:SDR family NAD(P)-dependent oxidoreductase [Dongia deserti]|uniref:SDR family NAD(P)-dependent oxidoreductase n=1 Tax=Dongia deserti TaxID=2268030 RepID=UPI000E6462F0|nr:SDR family NAD(P)-dependent oxidoreductase [Dongia deserti]
MNYFDNANYAVLVVGAGRGIGRAAALELAAQGIAVACFDSDAETAQKAAEEIKAGGGKAVGGRLDVTQQGTIGPAVEKTAAEFGRIDALVNCAGITGRTNIPAHEVDLEDFDFVYHVNLRGALLLSQAVLPHMLKRRYGRILHVSSIAGKEGNAGMTAYSATKAGLIGMVKSMAKDYVEQGITINALAPAVIRTPMVDALPQATVDYMTAKIPMRRCGELQEAAHMIAWIVSPACSFTTGFTFDLSGGRATY